MLGRFGTRRPKRRPGNGLRCLVPSQQIRRPVSSATYLGIERLEPRHMLAGMPVITEFMAANQGSLLDGDGNTSDWIEIHNAGDMPVDLANYYLTDDQSDLTQWQFPSKLLAAGEYLVVFASNQSTSTYVDAGGNLHTNFALGAGGEFVALVASDGTTVLSQFATSGDDYPAQYPDISYGASADGSAIGYFLTPTPGAANGEDPVSDPIRRVIISEIMYHPPGTSDLDQYIEIFNGGSNAIDLVGWRFNDGVEFVFPPRMLDPGSYLVVAADLARFQVSHSGVTNVVGGWTGRLSHEGERIRLADDFGRTIDSVTYADEGDWSVRTAGPLDHLHRGWIWLDDHDGGGKSLELINAAASNDYGQNWSASLAVGGSPGAANGVAATNVAPFILDTSHSPIVPRSTDPIVVRARLLDEQTFGVQATLRWRIDGAASFNATPMLDNGTGGDQAAGDHVFAASVPPQANTKVIEFYVEARDSAGLTRTWPAATAGSGQVANLLVQVDNSFDPTVPWNPASNPEVRLIMTEAERAELAAIGDGGSPNEHDSDAQMNGTYVYRDGTSFDVRYNVGIRNRGHGSRDDPPNNYRVNIPSDRPWQGVTSLNINSKYTYLQVIGSAVFSRAGIAVPNANAARVRVNGVNLAETGSRMYGTYAFLEEFSREFADQHFAPDPDGNLYAARRIVNSQQADLSYLGTDPNAYRSRYSKQSNVSLDDWSDLIHLTDVLNNAPQATYFAEVSQVVNVPQWLRFLALDALLGNSETSLGRGVGDDYELYRGVNDPRFLLVPHDLDTILGKGDNAAPVNRDIMLPAQVAGLSRFLTHPDILPLYQQAYRDLIDSVYNLATLSPLLHQILDGWVPATRIAELEQYIVDRTNGVLAQLPAKPPTQLAGGTLAANTTLGRAASPWLVAGDVVVPAGVTLTIEPGVTVYFAAGAGIDVAGRLVAQGTSAQRITLTRAPGVTGTWDGLLFNNTQQENRLAFFDMSYGDGRGHSIEANSSRLAIDNATWSGTQHTIIEAQNPALRVTGSQFPGISGGETIHTTAPAGTSYLILDGNTFGVNTSGDDVVDLGPAEGNEPPVQILNNAFLGGGDDGIDLDAVDALVEGNLFTNFHKNTSRDTTSNAVANGSASGTSNQTDVILRRNIFVNNDHHLLLKEGARVTSEHNVYFNADIAAVHFTEVVNAGEKSPSRGGTFAGDIFWQFANWFADVRPGVEISVDHSLVPQAGLGMGIGNLVGDPLFVDAESGDFHLRPTSPAVGTGPDGTDMGAYPSAVHSGVVINEVLVHNVQAFNFQGTFPSAIELYNRGASTIDLGDMRFTNNLLHSNMFTFTPGTTIAPGGYLTLLADGGSGPDLHLGFTLDHHGGSLYLIQSEADGGHVVDSVRYGLQIPDLSIGRVGPTGSWELTQPSFGAANNAQPTATASGLKINEWYTNSDTLPDDDFIELYNPASLPVALGGLFLTDDPAARPLRHAIAPLSYIAAGGFVALIADGNVAEGADHVGFRLSAEVGRIALFSGGPPLIGDLNQDYQVDMADFVVWRNTAGQFVPGGTGADANEDGVVDQADYLLWRADFGRSTIHPAVRDDAVVSFADVPGLHTIDFVTYTPQTADQSQGRLPNGGTTFAFFATPSQGIANVATASAAAIDDAIGRLVEPSRPRNRPTVRPSRYAAALVADDNALLALEQTSPATTAAVRELLLPSDTDEAQAAYDASLEAMSTEVGRWDMYA